MIEDAIGSELQTADVPQGKVAYLARGEGEPIVFVHGLLVNGRLWERVVEPLARAGYRCILPTWPMGSHTLPMDPEADLAPPAMARLVANFVGALGLGRVTLVGNDSGGAVSQIVATEHPEVVGRLVLTNCDAYEIFPPRMFGYLKPVARMPGGLNLLAQSMRLRLVRRAPIAFGLLAKKKIDADLLEEWVRPVIEGAEIRRDTAKFIRGTSPKQTMRAAGKFSEIKVPVLLPWGADDRFFTLKQAERMASEIPGARLEPIPDAKTFVSLDQPERVAELIAAFMRETSSRPVTA